MWGRQYYSLKIHHLPQTASKKSLVIHGSEVPLLIFHISSNPHKLIVYFTIYRTALIEIKGEESKAQDLNWTSPSQDATDSALHFASDFHVSKHLHEHYFGSSPQPCERDVAGESLPFADEAAAEANRR